MLKARYVVPVEGPVIENGGVVVDNGRITAVGPARELQGSPLVDYGEAVICPGFVNAHTHLELSLLAGCVPPGPDFVDWLRRLVAVLEAEPATRKKVHVAVRAGIMQSLASGVTLIGDITRSPYWTREVLAQSPLHGVSFGEVIAIGTRRHLLDERLESAAATEWQSDKMRTGISPHAPYTVEPGAMRTCVDRARKYNMPLCIHLAESPDEEPFTRFCTGPLVKYLCELGVWKNGDGESEPPAYPAGCGPVELAECTGLLDERTVIAHANYVTDDDIARIAASGASVAYCPRTHRAFNHPPHRFRDMLAAGINVCIGTDSLASNPTLSILDELRYLRREHPDLPAERIIAMGTIHGARALGFADTNGSLTMGKIADLAVIRLGESTGDTAWKSILDSTQPPTAVYTAGRLTSQR